MGTENCRNCYQYFETGIRSLVCVWGGGGVGVWRGVEEIQCICGLGSEPCILYIACGLLLYISLLC